MPSPSRDGDPFERAIRCEANPAVTADAFCSVCLEPYSRAFLIVRDDGRAVCTNCAEDAGIRVTTEDETDPALAGGWATAVKRVLLESERVLRGPEPSSIAPAMRFGYVCSLAGFGLWLFWLHVFQYDVLMETLREGLGPQATETILRWGIWLAMPLHAGIFLVVGAFAFHLSARLVGAPGENLTTHMRVFALSASALLLCAIPAIGGFIGAFVMMRIASVYLRSTYDASLGRLLLAMLPLVFVLVTLGPIR